MPPKIVLNNCKSAAFTAMREAVVNLKTGSVDIPCKVQDGVVTLKWEYTPVNGVTPEFPEFLNRVKNGDTLTVEGIFTCHLMSAGSSPSLWATFLVREFEDYKEAITTDVEIPGCTLKTKKAYDSTLAETEKIIRNMGVGVEVSKQLKNLEGTRGWALVGSTLYPGSTVDAHEIPGTRLKTEGSPQPQNPRKRDLSSDDDDDEDHHRNESRKRGKKDHRGIVGHSDNGNSGMPSSLYREIVKSRRERKHGVDGSKDNPLRGVGGSKKQNAGDGTNTPHAEYSERIIGYNVVPGTQPSQVQYQGTSREVSSEDGQEETHLHLTKRLLESAREDSMTQSQLEQDPDMQSQLLSGSQEFGDPSQVSDVTSPPVADEVAALGLLTQPSPKKKAKKVKPEVVDS